LLLKGPSLPRHYRYLSSFSQYSVSDWDGGIRQVMAIDIQNGWWQAAQESVSDPHRRPLMMSVQLFRSAIGARADFGQFFTNNHPETRFQPGATWLGATAIAGYGSRASIYGVQDDTSHCFQHVMTGLTFVYGNGIFSIGACTAPNGDAVARQFGKLLLKRARSSTGH